MSPIKRLSVVLWRFGQAGLGAALELLAPPESGDIRHADIWKLATGLEIEPPLITQRQAQFKGKRRIPTRVLCEVADVKPLITKRAPQSKETH